MKNSTTLLSALLLAAASAFAQPQEKNQLPTQVLHVEQAKSNVALLTTGGNIQPNLISVFDQNGDKGANPQLHVRNDPAQLEQALEAFPNPSNGLFKIRLPENMQVLSIEVYDMAGKLVFVDKGNVLDVPQDKTIDISAEEGAIFIVLVRTATKVFTQRVSVIR